MTERLLVCGLASGMDLALPRILDLGVELVVATDHPTEQVRRHASRIVRTDPLSADRVLRDLKAANAGGFSGVMSLGFDNPPAIAALSSAFGCPGLDVEVAANATEKDRRIATLRAAGLATPAHGVATGMREGLALLETIGLPAVVKPVDRTGSLGVSKISSFEGARDLLRRALVKSRSGRIVVERYLTGTEHTVTGVSVGGRVHFASLSDRDYSEKERFAPSIFERGDILPSALGPDEARRVFETVEAGVRALALDPAVFNTDVLVTPAGEVILIELTARLPGARIASDLVPLATGVDILPNAVRLALGRPIILDELRPSRATAVVQRYLPANGGRVDWVGDLRQVDRTDIHDLFWLMRLNEGRRLPLYRSDRDLIAGVIATGETVEQAGAAADRALRSLPLRVAA